MLIIPFVTKPSHYWSTQALIICDQSREGHNHAFRSIKASTFAVLTFGTPHGGANGAAMQVALMNVARVALSVNAQILNNLKSGSEHLWQLNRDYLPIIQDFKSIFFYEAKKTSIGLRSIMVSRPYTLDTTNIYATFNM